jgi:DNA-binding protein HU-beta
MNKAQLVDFVAAESGITKKDARVVIGAVMTGITNGLAEDGKVTLVGFGSFRSEFRNARTARNPQTGEPVDVPAKNVVKFRPSAALKEAVN